MSKENWYIWDHDKPYADTMHKRALGELPEMESAKAICEVLKPYYQSGMTLADIGCGGGHYLRSLRSRLDPSIAYVGVDATESYIQMAREAFPEVSFHVGDIYNLPFDDQAFDLVICCNLISFLPPPPVNAVKELIRISKKHVIIRVTIGVRNYIIKEIGSPNDGLDEMIPERDVVVAESDLKLYNYHNMYTETYYREVVQAIDPNLKITFVTDDMWQNFDNRALSNATGTRVINGQQVSGNLLLDWRFVIISR